MKAQKAQGRQGSGAKGENEVGKVSGFSHKKLLFIDFCQKHSLENLKNCKK
jgi:hypothetical protein